MDLMKSLEISAAAMRAQGTRLRVISENLANADSTAETPDGLPYRRRVVSFRSLFDQALGAETVRVGGIVPDPSQFERRYEPGHPSADAEGYVLYPNIDVLVEMMDMREAQRSYEANLNAIEVSRSMVTRTIELLRV
ncbi:MAG: flagellar basal body rod protein FlgC [Inquilinus sp.]|nr:flagellar basal body rod protein FlgC [Inquilinus sp.]